MRMPFFIVFLFLILLGSGQDRCLANDQHISSFSDSNYSRHQDANVINKDYGTLLIEDTELDLLEENHSGNNNVKNNKCEFEPYAERGELQNKGYLNLSHLYFLKTLSNKITIFSPYCGQKSPIYLAQNVLRI